MSHVIYEGLVTKDDLGPEFDQSTAPIKLKTGSGLLKNPVTGVVTVDPAFIAANTPPPVVDIFTNAATYSAGNLTIKDNNAGTPDVVVDLGDLKKVAIANTASVVLSGTGETATPLAATVTAIPAGVPIPAAQLSGVVPAANLPPTTNVLAVTGPNLVSTVNGVASSVPMASIVPTTTVSNAVTGAGAAKTLTTTVNGVTGAAVAIPDLDAQALSIAGNVISLTNGGSITLPAIPATTHVNTWTKAGGLAESVDGVASNVAIAAGTIVDQLGYNSAGLPVHQVLGNQPDFFSAIVATADTQGAPNGTTDRTEKIRREGSIGLRVDPQTTLDVAGSYGVGVTLTPIAGDYAVLGTDSTIVVAAAGPASTASRVITLPPANISTRRIITVKAAAAGSQNETIIVSATGGQVEDNLGTLATTRSFKGVDIRSRTYQSDGFNWQLIGEVNGPDRVVYNYNHLGNGTMPTETQVFNMYNGDFGNVTLPPVTQYSEPLTIVTESALPFTIATTNQVPGAAVINGVQRVPYTFYPINGVGWVFGGYPSAAPADFWRSGGTVLPDGTNDTTETIAHDGRIKIGGGTQTAPATALTVVNSGVSVVVPASGGGAIISDPTSSRIYLEHQSAPSAGRVMSLRSENGITTFASTSDTGAAFVTDSILGMTHSNGNIRFGSYPSTRNDSGTPVNILSTDVNGNLRSDPIADLLSTRTEIRETFVSTSGNLSMPAPTLASSPGLDLWTMQTLVEVIAVGAITLPAIPAALAPFLIGVEIDIKAFGGWTGAVTVAAPAGITIDNAATYVFNKVAGLQPSISVRYAGSKWLVV